MIRARGTGIIAGRRETQAKAIPSQVEFGIETHGFAKCLDRSRRLMFLVMQVAEIKPGAGVFRIQTQRLLQMYFSFAVAILRRQEKRNGMMRLYRVGIQPQCRLKFAQCVVGSAQQLEQTAA